MKLEVISRRPSTPSQRPPLLFVHGAFGAAWVWEQHFLPFFAARGFEAHALSLRGHGESSGWEQLPYARLRDYVADLEQVAGALPAPPVLIGHSMGGAVVQKYMHAHPTPAAVLMASVPPHGLIGSFCGIAFTNPRLFYELGMIQALGPWMADSGAVRRALFSDDCPEEIINAVVPRLQAESSMVVFDLVGLDLPPSTPSAAMKAPVLVLGAERDAFVFRGGLEATAKTYRTRPEIFPNMAHAMMLEAGWQAVAERICEWLELTLALEPVPSAANAQPAGTPPAEASAAE
ncbi:MAG: alpha/beta hydrolase [Rhodospirillales bacterium]|nr:alpha/beta hydrolase [Rhodospirillales bacterium]